MAQGSGLAYPSPAAKSLPQGLALVEFVGEMGACGGLVNLIRRRSAWMMSRNAMQHYSNPA